MSESELPSEFHLLDKAAWKEIKQRQGAMKGQDPIVLESGYVYVGKDLKGQTAKVFIKENKNQNS